MTGVPASSMITDVVKWYHANKSQDMTSYTLLYMLSRGAHGR